MVYFEARALYRTDRAGHVTAVDAGARPRLAWETESGGALVQVTVQCGKVTRSVRWRYGEGGALAETLIDMGSGLADTRYVMEQEDGRLARQRVLRRGEGVAPATLSMALDCTPWLGAGRGVYESPAAPDVTHFKTLGETVYNYDSAGNLVREETTRVRGSGTVVTYTYDDAGNLLQRETRADREPTRTRRYSYACWR